MSPHKYLKTAINAAAGMFGARVVGANWGPRGVWEMLERVKARGFSPALVFDIGASNGQWTQECRTVYERARYVMVDPLESNRDALQHLASSDDRISAFHGVAAASEHMISIHSHGDQSSILSSESFPGPVQLVEATTVDALFQRHGPCAPVLLKADVQGYELEVLKGAGRCLQATELLILEVSFRRIYHESALAHEIVAYVGERGFRIFDLCSYLQRGADHDLLQSDMVFVHESSSLFSHHGWV